MRNAVCGIQYAAYCMPHASSNKIVARVRRIRYSDKTEINILTRNPLKSFIIFYKL